MFHVVVAMVEGGGWMEEVIDGGVVSVKVVVVVDGGGVGEGVGSHKPVKPVSRVRVSQG